MLFKLQSVYGVEWLKMLMQVRIRKRSWPLSKPYPEIRTEENHEKHPTRQPVTQPRHEPDTSEHKSTALPLHQLTLNHRMNITFWEYILTKWR